MRLLQTYERSGRSKLIYFEHLVDKVRRKLDGWKAKIMSFAGKLNRIKSVLHLLAYGKFGLLGVRQLMKELQ